jgi:hypothetical protein
MTGKSKVAEKRRHFWTNSTIGVCHFNTETRFHANRLHELARANGVETHKLVDKNLPAGKASLQACFKLCGRGGCLIHSCSTDTLWKEKRSNIREE